MTFVIDGHVDDMDGLTMRNSDDQTAVEFRAYERPVDAEYRGPIRWAKVVIPWHMREDVPTLLPGARMRITVEVL